MLYMSLWLLIYIVGILPYSILYLFKALNVIFEEQNILILMLSTVENKTIQLENGQTIRTDISTRRING